VRLEDKGAAFTATTASGGLVTALSGLPANAMTWIGWPGMAVAPERQAAAAEALGPNLRPVFLSEEQQQHYYRDYCNAVLWPLFHYFAGHVELAPGCWRHYREVNDLFAEAVLAHAPADARVWIHDFHLMLLPGILRERRPDLEIGFFLHIPFPSSELYRLLPQRRSCCAACSAPTTSASTPTTTCSTSATRACACWDSARARTASSSKAAPRRSACTRSARACKDFETALRSPKAAEYFTTLRERYRGRKLVLGIERLDYTKGVGHKLLAFERYLERDPARASRVTLLQVVVPSRLDHPDYRDLKSQLEENIGRINGRYGTPGITPVEYLHRSIEREELVALYRFADAAMVTPVRDGMNLVAQEFVLCQGTVAGDLPACRGMLLLSEFAGASHPLSRSLLVNPWDTEQMADQLEAALEMSDEEKRERTLPMVERVRELDSPRWAETFVRGMDEAAQQRQRLQNKLELRGSQAEGMQAAFARAERRILFLDYDGTLREITLKPEEARPTPMILDLLARLSAVPETEVHLVSGRPRAVFAAWFAHLRIHLCAEHGYAHRAPGGSWQYEETPMLAWMPLVRERLELVAREVPGTWVEPKTCGLAWHYRLADLDYGTWRARELLAALERELANEPVEVLSGRHVIEVRASGIDKGRYARHVLAETRAEDFVLCFGDDRTDRDMFRAMPPHAFVANVGRAVEEARFTIASPARARELLAGLAAAVKQTSGASERRP
jgi:trehalose 6-phosphate synthase/phosphatase